MIIGLIDVDGHNFPNLPLMKLSAWHKSQGDTVEWYNPWSALTGTHYDRVYKSKVFTFTPDYEHPIYADEVKEGGTGYHYPDGGDPLPYEVEHIYPDYGIYPELTKDTAFGFLSRGCPRGCDFCIVKDKEGRRSVKVANLDEFWRGQKNINLYDPNMFACKDWRDLSEQLIASKALIEFNQGVDIRVMTAEKAEYIKRMRIKMLHFAWDRYEDKDTILPRFKTFREITGWDRHKMQVYVLANFNTTIEQDLERVYTLRDLGYAPYIMIYNKGATVPTDTVRRLQRYVNNRFIFNSCASFEEYNKDKKENSSEQVLSC